MLNALYEESFPGLRYITFVNGRSRAEIIPEIEVSPSLQACLPACQTRHTTLLTRVISAIQGILGISLPPPSANVGEPRLSATRTANGPPVQVAGSAAWRTELKRDLRAMWDIAYARLAGLGVH